MTDLKSDLGWTDQRRRLLAGFERWMKRVQETGIEVLGLLIGGSFVEKKDDPKDIDLVAFYFAGPDIRSAEQLRALSGANPDIFVKQNCIEAFGCDPSFILLSNAPLRLAAAVSREISFLSCSKDWQGKGILWLLGK